MVLCWLIFYVSACNRWLMHLEREKERIPRKNDLHRTSITVIVVAGVGAFDVKVFVSG